MGCRVVEERYGARDRLVLLSTIVCEQVFVIEQPACP
jgi:hypothetical protein